MYDNLSQDYKAKIKFWINNIPELKLTISEISESSDGPSGMNGMSVVSAVTKHPFNGSPLQL